MIINTKTKMYRYLQAGKFGNTMQIFDSLEKAPNINNLGVRFMKIGSINRCIPNISKRDLLRLKLDLSEAKIFVCPENVGGNVLNAELMRSHEGLNLRYKVGNMIMRQAMNAPDRAIGLRAKMILQCYLDATSYDTLMDLLDLYPDHVIEFSVFDKAMGIFERRTIIWEVRKY